MTRKQLVKIVDDYHSENTAIDFSLHQLEIQKRALKARQKIVKRKIIILNEKINKCSSESINWSCTDFDELDVLE